MLTASLFALALAAAEPTPVGAAPAAPVEGEVPAGAPADDYGLVAWCQGALKGHMELRDLVKDELDAVSPGKPADDAALQKAGEDYLDLYTRALRAAEKASPTPIQARGRAASATGYGMWAQARATDPRNRMWAYLMWDLPGRCETAAKRLEERSSLFGEALKPGVTPGVGPVASAPAPAAPAEQALRGPQ